MEHSYTVLVERARDGDVAAFSCLVREFQDLVMGTAYGWLGDAESARDVSQEAFLDAYVKLPQLREPVAFPGWLRRIVHKHCDRLTRRRLPAPVPLVERDGSGDATGDPAQDPAADPTSRQLRLAVQALPVAERMVVSLHYFAGLSGPELAGFLDLPLPTIKKRLRMARARLREQGDSLMEKTADRTRPSVSSEFADVVTFFLAIRAGDRARVKHMLSRSPALVDAVQEWDSSLVTDGVLPFASRATALITAIERDDHPLLTMLLDAGANVNGRCQCATGESPVWAATVLGRIRHLRTLLERGADPNRESVTGNMPLHVAAMRGMSESAGLLLSHGADPRALDTHGRTPGDWARANGHADLARMVDGDDASRVRSAPGVKPPAAAAHSGVLLTGIKALDLFCPIPRGGIVRIPFMAGVGMVVLLGELCRRVTMLPAGRALWTGFAQRPFDFKDWQTEISELGLTRWVQQSLADVDAAADARREAFQRGLEQAESLSTAGLDVLLVVTSDPAFESDVEASLPRLAQARGAGSITTFVTTTFPERDEATWPALRPPYGAQIKLDRARARRGLYPSLDPARSLSTMLAETSVGREHLDLAGRAGDVLSEYAARDPRFDAFEAGGASSDPHFAAVAPREARRTRDEDRAARALMRYLTQPFFVAEPFSGCPGAWVGHAELLKAIRTILANS